MGPSRRHWRRGRDSNPRYSFGPYTGLANQRLQPLGHLSRPVPARVPPCEGGLCGLERGSLSSLAGMTLSRRSFMASLAGLGLFETSEQLRARKLSPVE